MGEGGPTRERAMVDRANEFNRPVSNLNQGRLERNLYTAARLVASMRAEEIDEREPSSPFDPGVIANRLEKLTREAEHLLRCEQVIDIREKTERLIGILKSRDFQMEEIEEAGMALIEQGFEEEWSRPIKIIKEEAIRAISIIAPENDPLFELWIAEMTSINGIGATALQILGKQPAGIGVTTKQLAGEVSEILEKLVLS